MKIPPHSGGIFLGKCFRTAQILPDTVSASVWRKSAQYAESTALFTLSTNWHGFCFVRNKSRGDGKTPAKRVK
jgi:hypothetical protein